MMPQIVSVQRRVIVTSRDVAIRANVSRSTVSRALRGDPSIRFETRERIASAAEALGYRVDARASRLRRLRSDCVGIILVCDQPEQLAEELCEGACLIPELHRLITELGCEMLVSIQNSESPQNSLVHSLRADTSIIVGRPKSVDRWRAKILHNSPLKRFQFSAKDLENWGADFHSWLNSAVSSGQTACEIII